MPSGLTVNLTYNGSPNAPTNAGSYTVIGTISDPNYYGSATNTLVINPNATVTLGNLNQLYTGSAISVTVSTTPPGLTVNLTYNGSPNAPTNPGNYTVIGIISDPNYYGSATNTLVVGLPPQNFTPAAQQHEQPAIDSATGRHAQLPLYPAIGHQSDAANRLAMRLHQLCGCERQLEFYRHQFVGCSCRFLPRCRAVSGGFGKSRSQVEIWQITTTLAHRLVGRRCCAAGSANLQVSPTGAAFVPELMETAIGQNCYAVILPLIFRWRERGIGGLINGHENRPRLHLA